MSIADEIIVKLTAQNGDLNAGMDEAAAKVKASTDSMQASVASAMNTFRDFDNIQKGSIKTAQDVANAQATLTAAQATGAYTTEELAAKQAMLDAAMAKLPAEMEAASAATAGFTANSRVMGEVSTIISEAMSGNFGRIRRSAAALANQSGLLESAFRFLLSPAGLVTAAFVAIGDAAIEASEDIDKLARSASDGGGFVGMPPGDLEEIAQKFKSLGFDVRTARDTIDALASSGKVTSGQLENLARASLDLGQITGEASDKIADSLLRATNSGIRGIADLNSHYHFLTASQFDQIDTLYKQGESTKAASLAFDLLAQKEDQAREHLSDLTGHAEGFWASVGTAAANVWDTVGQFALGAETVNDQITQLDKQIKSLQAGNGQYEPADREKKINDLLAQRKSLLDDLHKQRQQADAQAKAEEDETNRENAIIHKQGAFSTSHVKDGDEAGLQQLEYAAQQQGHEMSLAEQKAYWQQRYDIEKDGGSAEAQNAQTAMGHIVELQKQMDAQRTQLGKEGARQRAQEERKADAATMQGLEVKRAATQEYSAQRIAIDATIVATAEKLYGQDSAQYRAALQQKLSDTRAFAQRQKELAVTQADGDRQIADAKISFEREQAQTEFDAGHITAQQLLQINLDLDRRKLAADVAYYNAKKTLDANDIKQTLQDNNQIVLAKIQANQRMEKDEQKFFKDSEKNWKQYSQRVVGSMQTAVNAMLFQHQSLRQGVASVAESMAENFIEVAVMKPLEKWITAEGMKLSASLGTLTTQTTAEETQRAANTAADIADKTAGVIRAAGLAGAQGTASFAGAPWPVDIGAPAFGVAMAATAASFASMASAAGGWERVPADGMLTELHRDEMVLPKNVADPVRNMAKNGSGGGGGDHITVHAVDPRSFADTLRRRPELIRDAIRHAKRRGY